MTFDRQPTLAGHGVTVRPMRPDDRDALYAVASDPLLWAGHPSKDRYQPEVFDALFADGLASGGGVVVEDADGRVVGSSRFYEVDEDAGHAAIGYTFLARDLWGTGTNAEVKRLMVDHVHRFVPRAIFHVGSTNLRSQAAMRKIGGVITHDPAVDTRPDHVVFEIVRQDA
ncbi:GNAT family N-acetyltransferase [Nigerium massiliense]|uniref:GNAT family N-acetyltransferase n=1 Tax=Nigerium massiliense TaxID=1522317 RepID=UPI0005917D18|nr:GNAT family N-acetyltransferase [Nigerium massiliense]